MLFSYTNNTTTRQTLSDWSNKQPSFTRRENQHEVTGIDYDHGLPCNGNTRRIEKVRKIDLPILYLFIQEMVAVFSVFTFSSENELSYSELNNTYLPCGLPGYPQWSGRYTGLFCIILQFDSALNLDFFLKKNCSLLC